MGNTIGGTDFMSAYTDPSLQGMPVLLQPPALQPTVQSVHPPTVQSHPQTSVEATAVQPPPAVQAPPMPPMMAPDTAIRVHMSTASAVVAQSAHNVMQQALSLQSEDQIVLYDNLRKHLHAEGLLRGMSVSAKSKRRVMCLKEGCPGYAMTASKKQATCKDGKNCGYHAQWGCTVCEEGKADFKRCVC